MYTTSSGSSGVSMVETLWTDDSGAYFVREDTGSAISWFTPTGASTSAPGTGIRPAGGASLLVDSTRYQASATATGYTTGDYISHVVTLDPVSGAAIGNFWINATQSTKLASPPSTANIVPVAPVPIGAALDGTDASGVTQLTGGVGIRGWLSGIYSKIAATLNVAAVLGTSNGWTAFLANAATNTKQLVKAAAGQVGLVQVWNPNTTVIYVQLFDAASLGAVTLGTTVPKLSVPIAPTANGGFAMSNPGIYFGTGIVMAVTTTATGSAAPTTAVDLNLGIN
jgi:hypothetical protein